MYHMIQNVRNQAHQTTNESTSPKRWLTERGVKRGSDGDRKRYSRNQTDTVTVCSEQIGVDPRTARRRRAEADSYESLPKKTRRLIDEGDLTVKKAIHASRWHPKRRASILMRGAVHFGWML